MTVAISPVRANLKAALRKGSWRELFVKAKTAKASRLWPSDPVV